MSKHTPGPWSVEATDTRGESIYVTGERNYVIAMVDTLGNAQFIAAAPEMAHALIALLAEVDAMTARVGWSGKGGRDAARAALAKAGL